MRVKRYIVLLIVLSSLLVGCATPTPATSPATSAPTAQATTLPADLTPKMVEELRAAGDIVVIDVREP